MPIQRSQPIGQPVNPQNVQPTQAQGHGIGGVRGNGPLPGRAVRLSPPGSHAMQAAAQLAQQATTQMGALPIQGPRVQARQAHSQTHEATLPNQSHHPLHPHHATPLQQMPVTQELPLRPVNIGGGQLSGLWSPEVEVPQVQVVSRAVTSPTRGNQNRTGDQVQTSEGSAPNAIVVQAVGGAVIAVASSSEFCEAMSCICECLTICA